MIAPLVAFPLLLAFWLFVCWRVRVEKGRVHLTAMQIWLRSMRRLHIALGLALMPCVRTAIDAMADWNRRAEETKRRILASGDA